MGTDLIELYNNRVKKEWKLAFISSILIGLLIHIYKFTNTLPNHDTLYNYYSDQNVIGSGRWLLSLACGISSYFDLPWVNGIISLFFIAITTAIVVDVLEIKNPFLICLSAGLIVAFPGITETFFFEFTADGYMLSMLLSALAVWFTRAEELSWKGTTLATVCVCCSCAIYQAYVSFALVLALCYFILKLLDNALSSKQIWKWIGTQVVVYVAGLAAYYVIWKLLMRIGGYVANDYQGISTLSLNLDTVLNGIQKSLNTLTWLFFEWLSIEQGISLYNILSLLFLGSSILVLVYAVYQTRIFRQIINLCLLLICCLIIPFSACMWLFVSQAVWYRPMMLQCVCILYILSAILYERYVSKILKNLFALLLVIIVFNNGIIANISYYYLNRTYFSSYQTASEMIEDIHNLDTLSKDIVVIGNARTEFLITDEPNGNKIYVLGQFLETNLIYNAEHLVDFINETFYEDFVLSDFEWQENAQVVEIVAQMGCWPEEDSIQLIDDVIFIKLKNID